MKDNDLIKINLGCGNKYLQGYINCDFIKTVRAEKHFDLNKFPYPFKDNYADEIVMDNVLEHLDNLILVMEELYRILKNKGKLIIIVPYGKSDGAIQDPTHVHFFTEKTFDYFTVGSLYEFYSTARFKKNVLKLQNDDISILNKLRNLVPFRSKLKYLLLNMYESIYVELEAVKKI